MMILENDTYIKENTNILYYDHGILWSAPYTRMNNVLLTANHKI